MDEAIQAIFSALKMSRYDLSSEAATQEGINDNLTSYFSDATWISPWKDWIFHKEKVLSKRDRVDFFIEGPGIAIEVKIKGSPMSFLKQCERYCEHDEVKALILATAKFTGFPEEINGKPIYLLHLSRGML